MWRGWPSIAAVALVAACAAPGATVAPASTAPSETGPLSTPTAVPTAAPDLEHPVGVIAIGHSGLTGEGTAGTYEPNPQASWATGTLPAVDSVYLRLVGVRPETEGRVANTARGGASAVLLSPQAEAALQNVPVPELAIVQTVDNDINCEGTNIADVGEQLAAALALIHDASPNTKILVALQLGRPDAAYVRKLVAYAPSTKADLTFPDDCSFFDAAGNLRIHGLEKLSAVIDRYEAEEARVCAAVANCVTDGGVRKAYLDKIENFSPDYAHLNVRGQAAEAALIWPVVEDLLGL
jgi:hypothetical protein